ncbi:hypothetical protein Pint_06957 [Pistacia integerrima]|uniref:Uncharacterized protein n=1 Tax=Pistacia integerrima TaxID=434235 RepID=A0ACC0XV36_9ROSI|nr:hypothetical protein Pint_06957 [Pistacia integerrima]
MISILNLLFQIVLLLSLPINTSVAAFPIAKLGCTPSCGNVSIPFPFGIEEDCYLEDDFAIDCNSDKPFLRNLNLEVLDISLDGTLRVNHEVLYTCDELGTDKPYVNLENTSFYYSQTGNRFTALGCNNLAFMSRNETVFGGCFSTCGESSNNSGHIKISISDQGGCYGINCCQAKIPSYLQTLNVSVRSINYEEIPGIPGTEDQGCKSAFLVDQIWFAPNFTYHITSQNLAHVPVVLDWGIFNFSFIIAMNKSSIDRDSYICAVSSGNLYPFVYCNCTKGYEGNPYLLQGCQDIDECKSNVCGSDVCINVVGNHYCSPHRPTKLSKINLVIIVLGTSFGSLFLLVGAWWLSIIIKKRKEKKLKENYFKQNGSLLLERQLTSSDGSVDRSKLFNSKDLDKATDHFNVDRKIGEGGQGTVYKGMLANGRIVAVKKSKVVDDNGKLQEFVNEENHLFDILSSQVKSEGKDEEIMAVANLTYRCVNLKGSKRPTMKEVSMELQRIRASENNNLHQNYEEVENMRSEVLIPWDGPSISTGSTFDNTVRSTDFQPLLNAI